MGITYYLNRRDLFWGQMIAIFRNRAFMALSVLLIGFFAFTICSCDEFHKAGLPERIFFIVFSIVVACGFYLVLQFIAAMIMVTFGKHVGLLGAHTLEIKDDGLEESTTVNKSLHRWNPSFRISESGNYVWIYPTDGRYFLVPKRPGGHEGNLAEFVLQLRTKIGR